MLYQPSAKQMLFHIAMVNGKRFVLLVGGRRGGKTRALSMEAVLAGVRNHPPHESWVVSPTYQLSEIPEKYFIEDTQGLIRRARRDSGRRVYEWNNGHRTEFKTADDPERLRGPTLGDLFLDEACMMSEDVYDIVRPTVAIHKGRICASTTPRGHDWVYHKLYLKSCRGHESYDPEYYTIRMSSYDNPVVDKREIDSIVGEYSSFMRKQEIYAEFVSFEGKVLRDFDPGTHCIPDLKHDDKGVRRVIAGIDFGVNDPFVYLWIALWRGHWVIVDEYYRTGSDVVTHVGPIKRNLWEPHVDLRMCDPHDLNARSTLQRYGVVCTPAPDHHVKVGIDELRRLLETKLEDGKPALLVCERCKNVIREFEAYRYRDKSEQRDAGEKPLNKDDHCPDAARYALYSQGSQIYHGPVAEKALEAPVGSLAWWMNATSAMRNKDDGFLGGRDSGPRSSFWPVQ